MPATTMAPASSGTGQTVSPLAALEATTDPDFICFLAHSAGPVEGIELSPDYFYNWHNWSNGNCSAQGAGPAYSGRARTCTPEPLGPGEASQ